MTAARRPTPAPGERVLFGIVRLAGLAIQGYVLDPEREGDTLVVEFLLDGLPHGVARADLYDATLAEQSARNPHHGFLFVLPQAVIERASVAEVRLANDGTLVGRSLHLPADAQPVVAALGPGRVSWLGGLRFGGWLPSEAAAETLVRGLIDENKVAETRPHGWMTIDRDGSELAVRAFEFEVPARFADARAHRIEVITGDGHTLTAAPLPFVAFEDGLAAFLARQTDVAAEKVRGAVYDQLMPQSLPFSALADWRRRFAGAPAAALAHPVAVVLVGEDNLDASIDSLQAQGDVWIAGVMALRGESAEFDPADLVAFLDGEAASCVAVVFARAGTTFILGALQRLAQPILEDAETDCVYADVVLELGEGRDLPLAHASFDRERMIEQGYAASLFALRRDVVVAAARAGAGSLHRIFLAGSGIEGTAHRTPLHVPGFLARLPRQPPGPATDTLLDAGRRLCANLDIQARIEPVVAARLLPAIRLRRRPAPCLVSAMVLVRNGADALRGCLDALKAQDTVHDIEIIVVDNDSTTADTAALLAEIASDGVQIVRVHGPANVARSMNSGAAVAGGSYLLFLDQHVTLTSPDAVDEMLSRCSSQATGAVGGVLTWPSGAVCDAGLVLNFRDGASKAFRGLPADNPGYAETLLIAREVSAVSGQMMMVARDTFDAAGGMDDIAFPLFFPSVAFCLASAAIGHRTVVTPYARAVWTGRSDEASRNPEHQARLDRELAHLRQTWPAALANDPFYSPLLNLDGQLHTALAWPPRDEAPRRPRTAPTADKASEPAPSGRRKI